MRTWRSALKPPEARARSQQGSAAMRYGSVSMTSVIDQARLSMAGCTSVIKLKGLNRRQDRVRSLLWIAMLLWSVVAGAQEQTARPFPHHSIYTAGVIRPSKPNQAMQDATIARFYASWKAAYLRKAGGHYWVKYNESNTTVSEAHGYGMVLAAYMGDHALFDSMFHYFKAHPSAKAPHLMAWKQTLRNGRMRNIEGSDSATDSDLDIAYALLLAHVQWGSLGGIPYQSEALATLHAILAHEVNPTTQTFMPGDWATGKDRNHTRPSDFMTEHVLAFAAADPANGARWRAIHRRIAAIVNHQARHGSVNTALMPDFMVKANSGFEPVPGQYLEGPRDGDFSYNACRTPWRLAMSYVVQGNTAMLTALRKQNDWIRRATRGRPAAIKAGYYVASGENGTAFVSYPDLAFTAPFAVLAMTGGSDGQAWLNSLWAAISGKLYGARNNYYGDSIRLQVMLTVAGDWWLP
jgi:endoglucanase